MHSSQGRGLSLIPKDIQSIARGNVRDQIVRQLIELIVAGRFPAGTCLPAERELCQQFNVSRAGVREAVGILASQGFLTVRQGSGTFVNPSQSWNPLDPIVLLAKGRKAALEEVIEARQLLEPLIAALAADRATPEEITALEQYVRLARTVDEDVGMDVAFHSNLARASHNRVLVIMLHSVNELIQEARREAFAVAAEMREQTLHRHVTILEKVKQGDAPGARVAMEQHLRDAKENFLAALQRQTRKHN